MIVGVGGIAERLPRLHTFLTLFDELLDRAATPALPSFLTYDQRLELVFELLLAHPPIRGGSRPRDYPMGHARAASLEMARLLATTRGALIPSVGGPIPFARSRPTPNGKRASTLEILYGAYGPRPAFRLFDLVVAIRVCRLVGQDSSSTATRSVDDPDALCLLGQLLGNVLRDLAECDRRERGASAAEARRAIQQALRFCARLLGMSTFEEWAMLGHLAKGRPSRCLIQRAKAMAFLTACSGEAASEAGASYRGQETTRQLKTLKRRLMDRVMEADRKLPAGHPFACDKGVHEAALDDFFSELETQSFGLLSIKVRHVQRFLRRCRSSFIQRGASAWCSQTIARLRDHLSAGHWGGPSLPILVDSNAVVVLAVPRAVGLDMIQTACERFLSEWAGAGSGLHEDYPRLATALLAGATAGLSPRVLHPDVALEMATLSLAEFAIQCEEKDLSTKSGDRVATRLIRSVSERGNPRPKNQDPNECQGVWGELAFPPPEQDQETDLRIPPWYSPIRRGKEQYGLVAWGYALSGVAWGSITNRGVLESVNQARQEGLCSLPAERYFDTSPFRPPRLETWGSETEMVVRIDGNDVGEILLATPRARVPSLSPCLESDLGQRWLEALIRVLNRVEDCPRKDTYYDPRSVLLPAHLLYFGGDDLQFQIASSCWDEFWTALTEVEPRSGPSELGELSYKVAAVEIPLGVDAAELEGFLFADACMPSLLGIAKSAAQRQRVRSRSAESVIRAAKEQLPMTGEQVEKARSRYTRVRVAKTRGWQLAELRMQNGIQGDE